jgi:hypothetical protein
MHAAVKIGMASILALSAMAPAVAQPAGTPYRPTDEFMAQQRRYEQERAQYEANRDAYRNSRRDYRAARADYDRQMTSWEAARAAYDARYGAGAYVRTYGPAPTWDERQMVIVYPSTRQAYGANGYNGAPAAGYYGSNTAYAAPVKCNNNAAVTAGIIGALAGGVLGSNIAGGGHRTGGTVLGALVGGGAGAAIGHAHDAQKCDERGAYYTYNDTLPYRTSDDVYRDPKYSYYQSRGCRLAPAPVNDTDYRYVRVCPDPDGRYRVTG